MKARPAWVDQYKTGARAPTPRVEMVPDLFPTPPALAARMVEMAKVRVSDRVLEPSAGTGNLLAPIVDRSDNVIAVEINVSLVISLRSRFEKGDGRCIVYRGDFLALSEPGGAHRGPYDVAILNPPYTGWQDVNHIRRAASLLAKGGRLVALCAAGPRQERELRPMSSSWEVIEDAFRSQGTGVRVALMTVDR